MRAELLEAGCDLARVTLVTHELARAYRAANDARSMAALWRALALPARVRLRLRALRAWLRGMP